MFNWFSHPLNRHIYAVTYGALLGEMLIFIKQENDLYCFLSMPENINRRISREQFEIAKKDGILEFVSKIPRSVKKISALQYQKNESYHRC